jgi:hypothetical protein
MQYIRIVSHQVKLPSVFAPPTGMAMTWDMGQKLPAWVAQGVLS